MRILFTRFPLESAHGGAEIQTLSLMKGLSERGHDVSFLGSCQVLWKEVSSCGFRVAGLDIGIPPVTKWRTLSFVWRQKKMKKLLIEALETRNPQPETIIMLSLSEKLLLTETAVAKGIKVFWVEHDRVGAWLRKNPWLPRLRRLSKTVTTVCVSKLSKNIYVDLGWDPGKIVVIPNGVELTRSAGAPLPSPPPVGGEGGSPSVLRLGCVARLSPEKGVDLLIKAVADLDDVSLTIIGTGPEQSFLQQLINQPTNQPVNLIPRVADLSSFYRSIDVLILPSRDNDPFGLVIAEAMACGTPVVVTDQCGIAGYLKDGTDAVIVEAGSVGALKQGIARMQNPDLRKRLSEAGKITASEKFSVETMIANYERLLTASSY